MKKLFKIIWEYWNDKCFDCGAEFVEHRNHHYTCPNCDLN